MSYEPTNESSRAELEAAAENNDIVTNDELGEMHPDMTLGQIGAQLEYDEQVLKASNPEPYEKPRAAARQGRKTFNTGPKGVLTDFEEAKLKMRARRLQENMKRKEKVYMKHGMTSNDKAVKPFSIKYSRKKPKNKDKGDSKRDSDDDDSDSDSSIDSDDDDAEILKIYKQKKLEQMEKYRPKYGSCMEVTAWTFEEKVEHAPKDVVTVMHVYQDYMDRCADMNKSLSDLSRVYPHVQFLRARSDRIALDDYPEIGLPTLIIWKNGDQTNNFIAMQTLVETPFTARIIQDFLIKNKVLEESVEIIDKPTGNNKDEFLAKHGKGGKNKKVVDDDDSDGELDID